MMYIVEGPTFEVNTVLKHILKVGLKFIAGYDAVFVFINEKNGEYTRHRFVLKMSLR